MPYCDADLYYSIVICTIVHVNKTIHGSCSLQNFYCPGHQTRWYPVNPQSSRLPHRSPISLGGAKMRGSLLSPSSTGVVGCPIELVSSSVCVFYLLPSLFPLSLLVYFFTLLNTHLCWRNFHQPFSVVSKLYYIFSLHYTFLSLIPFLSSVVHLLHSLETLTTSSSTFTLPFLCVCWFFFSLYFPSSNSISNTTLSLTSHHGILCDYLQHTLFCREQTKVIY